MKKFLNMFERVFSYYFISMGLQLGVLVLLNIPLKFVISDYNNLTEFIVAMLVCLVAMFLLCFRDGYKSRVLEFKRFFICIFVLLGILSVVIYFIGRAIYISGPTDYLARYIVYKVNPTLINGKAMLDSYSLYLMIGAFVGLYVPTMACGMYLGHKKRKNQFKKS